MRRVRHVAAIRSLYLNGLCGDFGVVVVGVDVVLVAAPVVEGLVAAVAGCVVRPISAITGYPVKAEGDDRRMRVALVVGRVVEV